MVKLSCTCEMEGVRSGLCAPTPICRMPRVSTALPACCHPGNNPVRRAIVISPILHISGEIEAEGEKAACPPWQRQGVNWRLLGRALGMRVCRLSVFQGPLKESTEAPHSSLSLSPSRSYHGSVSVPWLNRKAGAAGANLPPGHLGSVQPR